MNDDFKTLLNLLLDMLAREGFFKGITTELNMPLKLTGAFLTGLRDEGGTDKTRAMELLSAESCSHWGDIAKFYLNGITLINEEIIRSVNENDDFRSRLKSLNNYLGEGGHNISDQATAENLWSLFFPEGCNILFNRNNAIDNLRNNRLVSITEMNPDPVTDPGREVLFTSNLLLTLPMNELVDMEPDIKNGYKEHLLKVKNEGQLYWYDHPMEIGTPRENNEFLFGVKGFNEAISFEKKRGNLSPDVKPPLLISVSVTHKGLHEAAGPYLNTLLAGEDAPDNLDIYLFTEKDTQEIVKGILIPAAETLLNRNGWEMMQIFGVDGEYGRHYSFLKAISLFWNILIDERVKATFKIDLDQQFPQGRLVHETGKSAFEHLKTGLWGATGIDSKGAPVELGMIAGALVNDDDIIKGLFTPDVPYPRGPIKPDEMIFFSRLSQALSTEGEIMTRYNEESNINGRDECIERIHVTGGTTGILVESLKRHRPFTPSFIGRAEDQAYIISTLFNRPERLAYLHEDGLIMQHDKKTFSRDEDIPTKISKLIGDYIRIIYFSALAKATPGGIDMVKKLMDPYTGSFISFIPYTICYLRFVFKALSLAYDGKVSEASEFIRSGAKRISAAIDFCSSKDGGLKGQYELERKTWRLYYDTMSALDDSIRARNPLGLELREKARNMVNRCLYKRDI